METWEYLGEKFVIVRFTIEHYTNINVYDLDIYTPFFGDYNIIEYLRINPEVKILILEESEADNFFRRPIVIELHKFRKNNRLKNEVVLFFQGTGQEVFIDDYVRRHIPPYITLVQSHTAPYNLMHNWVKTYSQKHYSYEELEDKFTPDYSLQNINIKKKFLVFAGKPRVPRLMVLGELIKNNLLESSYYNFGVEYIKRFKEFMDEKLVDQILKLHGHKEYSADSGKLEIDFMPGRNPTLSKDEEEYLRDIHRGLPIKDIPHDGVKDYYYTPNFIIPDPKLYKDIFLDFVLETFSHRGTYNDGIYGHINFFTEKIFKPVLTCRPFMVLGNKHYLRDLKEKFGFKSFDKYWDESYDDKEDIRDALPIIFNNLNYLNKLNNDELKVMLLDMKDILEHNNTKAREFLEGHEPWINVMETYIDGNGKYWQGKKGASMI